MLIQWQCSILYDTIRYEYDTIEEFNVDSGTRSQKLEQTNSAPLIQYRYP